MTPSNVVTGLSVPQYDCRSCACRFHTHLSYSVSDVWTRQYYYFWGRSCLCPSWDARRPYWEWLLEYLGQRRSPVSRSWCLSAKYCCRSPKDTAPAPSSYWQTCTRIFVQVQICIPIGHCTIPWSWYWLWFPDLGFWSASHYLCTSWAHIFELPVLHYQKIMVINYYLFCW